ncbi:uncharacterized protein LOC133840728 isoform X1 [Drosophila sulfurigaster albostrigata]|uniref:uncharacterized protein LOC133840728 isoform X1 n=1 Tax=Drosophila sulfurigaster albostrigata TaxID=89887 RepID=UPI002D21DBB2|nr:uncharacterized protein LOC133840728 isoform X1 [Drosophila sulfurigaster albostrigata]
MSISERNTPSHGAPSSMATPSHRQHHRPPDVEEALSSMLWTPYERTTPTASSSDEDDDDERLNRKLRKSQSNYETSRSTALSQLLPPLPLETPPAAAAASAVVAAAAASALPVPFPNFSLSGGCAFEAAKTSRAGGHRNRYSYPSYYGSPAHTLTQWCSSAATAIKEPPSYESLYEASVSSVGAARASLARVQPNNLQCDRSQRSRAAAAATTTTEKNDDDDDKDDDDDQLTANVPAERLVRSFTDDYISQNCALYNPAINDTQKVTATTQRPTTTNARSQQSAENQNDSRANCIINENSDNNVDDEQEIATTTTTTGNEETGAASVAVSAVAVQVNQPVSCAAVKATAALNRTLSLSQSLSRSRSRSRSHCVSDNEQAGSTTTAAESGNITANERASTTATERASTTAAERVTLLASAGERCSTTISLSSSFGACTTDAYNTGSNGGYCSYNNTLSSWLSRGRYNNNSNSNTSSSDNASSSDALRPNKCLAELERLYAEFRASESLFEHRLSQSQIDSDNDNDSDIDIETTMRLNVAAELPPAGTGTATATAATQTANGHSSVFLKASDCNDSDNNNQAKIAVSSIAITPAATKSCQRQPSLTIQVNNGSSNNNNGNNCVASPTSTTVATATQEPSILNNNGVCVVNCNYSNNNHNNNNSSIVAINNCAPASKVFSASVQNKLNNNAHVDVQHVAATDSGSGSSVSVSASANSNSNASNLNNNNANANANTNGNDKSNVNVNVSSANNSVKVINVNATPPRTFTSTECQTDDLTNNNNNNDDDSSNINNNNSNSPQQQQQLQQQQLRTREQRRRERRERRQQQQQQQQQLAPQHPRRLHVERHSPPLHPPPPHLHHPHPHPHPHAHQHPHPLPHPHPHPHPAALGLARALLPDILHSHYPPPYSALPGGGPPPLPPPPQVAAPLPPPPPPQAPVPMLTPVISTVPLPGAAPLMSDGRFTLPLPIMRRSPSERSGKGCCGQWFAGPPLRALIAVVALGGVACALGGAALGATGLAGPPNSHLTAALLMIGVGVVLVTVSGAAWRMTAPGGQSCLGLGTSVDLARCGRRPCTRGGGAPHGLLYPEFQHRPPPPSYQASMQEYRLRLLLLDRDRQNGVVRGNSPPPTYRSHAGSLLRAPLTTLRSGIGNGGGTISSSMGGSEYSLPPSYRSRNATPASLTLSSERTIETAPSGRLLANEDLPEPSAVAEQLPDYSALQSNTLLTSAIVEIESRNRSQSHESQQNAAKSPTTTTTTTTTKAKDLVTIVTISQANSENVQSGGRTQAQLPGQASSALDQIDILAHL